MLHHQTWSLSDAIEEMQRAAQTPIQGESTSKEPASQEQRLKSGQILLSLF